MRKYRNPKAGFDPACRTLAEHFLQDEPALADGAGNLAASIQQAVEDWFESEQAERRRVSSQNQTET